ncbi:MAG: CHAP domain-containing protein, partial [bacterium]
FSGEKNLKRRMNMRESYVCKNKSLQIVKIATILIAGIFFFTAITGCGGGGIVRLTPNASGENQLEQENIAQQLQPQSVDPAANARAVWGVSKCDSVSSQFGSSPYPCCDNNGNNKVTDAVDGNCTWFAWWAAKHFKGWDVPATWGNGREWCGKAMKTPGWLVTSTPIANSIACGASGFNHVAWTYYVSPDKKTIKVYEQGCTFSPSLGYGLRQNKYAANRYYYIIHIRDKVFLN